MQLLHPPWTPLHNDDDDSQPVVVCSIDCSIDSSIDSSLRSFGARHHLNLQKKQHDNSLQSFTQQADERHPLSTESTQQPGGDKPTRQFAFRRRLGALQSVQLFSTLLTQSPPAIEQALHPRASPPSFEINCFSVRQTSTLQSIRNNNTRIPS